MRIQKISIKVSEKGNTRYGFVYEVNRGTDEPDEFSINSKDKPRPEFLEILAELKQFVIDMCELKDESTDNIDIRGLSFSYAGEDEVMGVTITALRTLENSSQPLVLNTPHKIADFYSENGDPKQLMPTGLEGVLIELCDEGVKYIGGDRGTQMELFKEKKETVTDDAKKIAEEFSGNMQKLADETGSTVSLSTSEKKVEFAPKATISKEHRRSRKAKEEAGT